MNKNLYVLIEEYNHLVGYIVTKEEFQKYIKEADTDELNYIIAIHELKAAGKTYQDKKKYIENIAIDFSNADNGNNGLDELQIMYNFFETYGKRFGLMADFRENAII